MRHISDDERRARIAVRHALGPQYRVESPEAAACAMTALHATEPATVYLSCWARVNDCTPADVDRALYDQRSVVKQLAMRRTLFGVPRDLLPAVWSSASARVAATERSRLARDAVRNGLADDGDEWIDRVRAGVLAVLADAPEGRTSTQIRQAVPELDVTIATTGGLTPSAPRVIAYLAAAADLARATNGGAWHLARPRWALMRHWLPEATPPMSEADGYREIVRRWLWTFGPGTEADLVWWLGSTKAVVRTALAALDAEPASLDGGAQGWLLPDDVEVVADPRPWVALLPVLDPTVMGWRDRDFYLGPHRDLLFDRNGNAGTTAWVDGRAVGAWSQDDRGEVAVRLLERVSAAARHRLDAEAARLSTWLNGLRIPTVYSSLAMKASIRDGHA